MNRWPAVAVLGATLGIVPCLASAHSFGRVYNLPVPFWLYAWSSAAVLVATFLAVAYFATAKTPATPVPAHALAQSRWLEHLQQQAQRLRLPALLKFMSVCGLMLCIATGLFGSNSPYGNFNMTFFWIVFVLGFAYLTVLIGDLYAVINPWRLIAAATDRVVRGYGAGCLPYPPALGYWPAVALYMAFIWLELLGRSTPYSLSLALLTYTAINLAGVGLVGARDWFRYCEFFSVLFRLLARMAPLDYQLAGKGSDRGSLRLRAPFSGLLDAPAESISLLVFILFILSSTAFDGLRETLVWQRLFWLELYQAGLRDWVGHNPLAAFPLMAKLFVYWQGLWLLLSPFLYLAMYLAVTALARWLTRASLTTRELALQFALTLMPIALVYNISHYYTLIQTQGVKIISLASDPFGWGWNLFGTARWFQAVIIPDANTVWHAQVLLIVLGHVVSVVLSHRVALRLFPSRRQALLSQVPMLLLMVLFTTAGLWILSQPMK